MNGFNEILNEIRNRSNIVDIVSEYTQLKKNGQYYLGLCPFHTEKTPSFNVCPRKQLFHCFGCGVGGDRFKFVMEIQQLTFKEAVQYLAAHIGLSLSEATDFGRLASESPSKQLLLTMELAAKYYQYQLLHTAEGERALAYLAERHISDTSIRQFGLGYAGGTRAELVEFLELRGISQSLMSECGLLRRYEPHNFSRGSLAGATDSSLGSSAAATDSSFSAAATDSSFSAAAIDASFSAAATDSSFSAGATDSSLGLSAAATDSSLGPSAAATDCSRGSTVVDVFRQRLIFPIYNQRGEVIAFGGRLLGAGEPKYLNSSETPLFTKRDQLYNFAEAKHAGRKEGVLLLLEGYLDVISAWQAGIFNAVATLGTALSLSQAKMIRRVANKVILCYDADLAGQKATDNSAPLLMGQGCTVQVAELPMGQDPDDVLRINGVAAFKALLAEALPYATFSLTKLKDTFKLADEEGRLSYLLAAVKVIATLPTAIEADHYLRQLAEQFAVSLASLQEEYRKEKRTKDRKNKTRKQGNHESKSHMQNRAGLNFTDSNGPIFRAEQFILAVTLSDARLITVVMEQLGDLFSIDNHAVIAATLYQYAERIEEFSVELLLEHFRDQPALVSTVTNLAMLQLPDNFSADVLQDYINYLKREPHRQLLKAKREELAGLSQTDPMQAAQLGLEINKLQLEIKNF